MPTITRLKDLKKHTPHNRKQSYKYYSSKQWRMLRDAYIRQNPLCEVCLKDNIITAAEHVHHIQPFLNGLTDEQRWSLLLDKDNLMSVCRKCHSEIHKQLHIDISG
jgi:5-methylcytosine-specific restriction protein A